MDDNFGGVNFFGPSSNDMVKAVGGAGGTFGTIGSCNIFFATLVLVGLSGSWFEEAAGLEQDGMGSSGMSLATDASLVTGDTDDSTSSGLPTKGLRGL